MESEKQSEISAEKPPGQFDEDGLPLDRPPTLDDVRGNAGSGRTIAIGCSILVIGLVLGFWLIRAALG